MENKKSFIKTLAENCKSLFAKENRKKLERTLLLVGAITLATIGLFWNLYSDIVMKLTSQYLFLGLLTSIVGGVFLFVGNTMNNFDVKVSGIVMDSVGLALAVGNIVYLFVLGFENVYSIITLIFVIIGLIVSIIGFVFQVLRFKHNEE